MEPLSEIDHLVSKLSNDRTCLCLTSINVDAGCDFIALSLAERLVTQGHRCLLVELDNDTPRLGMMTGVGDQHWHQDFDQLMAGITTLPNGLDVLAPRHSMPSACRRAHWLKQFIEVTSQGYDRVILIGAPVFANHFTSPTPGTLVAVADETFLVIVARRDTQADVLAAARALSNAGKSLTGTIINDCDNPKLADSLIDSLAPSFRRHPLLFRRLSRWLRQVSIFNIEY